MRNREKGIVEYKNPIPIVNFRKYSKVNLTLSVYSKCEDNMFICTNETMEVLLKDVIMRVTLETSEERETDSFVMIQHDLDRVAD